MRKFLLPGILLACFICLPAKSQAVPLDVPNAQVVDGTATTSVQLSTAAFPNSNYSWCIDHLSISVGNGIVSNFELFYATQSVLAVGSLITATTNYMVVTSSSVPFDTQFGYRTPYCAPPSTFLTLYDNVAGAIISFEAYMWSGWNAQ